MGYVTEIVIGIRTDNVIKANRINTFCRNTSCTDKLVVASETYIIPFNISSQSITARIHALNETIDCIPDERFYMNVTELTHPNTKHFNTVQFLIIMGIVIVGFIIIIVLFFCFFVYYGKYIKKQIQKETTRQNTEDHERRITQMNMRKASEPGYIGLDHQINDESDSEIKENYDASSLVSTKEGQSIPIGDSDKMLLVPQMNAGNGYGHSNSEALYDSHSIIKDGSHDTTTTTDGSIAGPALRTLSSEIHHIFETKKGKELTEEKEEESSEEIYDDPQLKIPQISSAALSNIIRQMEEPALSDASQGNSDDEVILKQDSSLKMKQISSTHL